VGDCGFARGGRAGEGDEEGWVVPLGGGHFFKKRLSVAFVSSHTCLLDPFQILQTCLRSLLGVFCR
jgi:hypothetical protein